MRVQRTVAIRDAVVPSTFSGNSNTFSSGTVPYGLSSAGSSTTVLGTEPQDYTHHVMGWFSVPYFPNVGLEVYIELSGFNNSLNGGLDYDVWLDLLNESRSSVVASTAHVNIGPSYESAIVRFGWNVASYVTAGAVSDRLILIRFGINVSTTPAAGVGFTLGHMWIDTPGTADNAVIMRGVLVA